MDHLGFGQGGAKRAAGGIGGRGGGRESVRSNRRGGGTRGGGGAIYDQGKNNLRQRTKSKKIGIQEDDGCMERNAT